MKDYLRSWIPKIKNYSLELDKLSKLYNQPWVIINEQSDFVKLIFQEKGKLIISVNGVVSDGSWELISGVNSILLDISREKRLYNHQFLDNGIMVLKLDGPSNDFFVLANQNIVPDLDVENYLINKYSKPIEGNSIVTEKLYEKEIKLANGEVLQLVRDLGYSGSTEVRISHKVPKDGIYRLFESQLAYEIQNGKLQMEYYIDKFSQEDGAIIEVGGNRINGITKGSPVWVNNQPAPDGIYKKGWFSTIRVSNGRII